MNDWMRDLATGEIEDLPDPFESWEYQPEPEIGDIGVFNDPAEGRIPAQKHDIRCSSGCDPTAHMNREEKRAFKRSFRKRGR